MSKIVTFTFSPPSSPPGHDWGYFCWCHQRLSYSQLQWVSDSEKTFLNLCSLNNRGTSSFRSVLPLDSMRQNFSACPYWSLSWAPLPSAALSVPCPPPDCFTCPPWMISLTLFENLKYGSIESSSAAQSCPTLCDSMDCSTPGFTVHHHLLELSQTHVHWVMMPSNHLILCCPLLLLPWIFPSIRGFSSESTLRTRWSKYWSFSFSISPSNEYSVWFPLGLTGLISLQSKGLSWVFSNATVQKYICFPEKSLAAHQEGYQYPSSPLPSHWFRVSTL